MKRLDKADIWLIEEISKGLRERFGLKPNEVEKMIKKSNFLSLLYTMPEQVHHDSPSSWVDMIARKMKLKESRILV